MQIAREQWLNKLGLTADAALEFDAAIDAMNAELLASIQAVADLLAADQELTPELGVRLFSEMSAALAQITCPSVAMKSIAIAGRIIMSTLDYHTS